MVDINTTPLIDVMLVLLIMFIITIPIQTHAVKMNMPVPSNARRRPSRPPSSASTSTSTARSAGTARSSPTAPRSNPSLQPVAAEPDQPEVHLRPNKLVTYKHVAMVMASAQRLGVTKIGIVGNEQFLN
jgi:biopolymer transport protein ExbD